MDKLIKKLLLTFNISPLVLIAETTIISYMSNNRDDSIYARMLQSGNTLSEKAVDYNIDFLNIMPSDYTTNFTKLALKALSDYIVHLEKGGDTNAIEKIEDSTSVLLLKNRVSSLQTFLNLVPMVKMTSPKSWGNYNLHQHEELYLIKIKNDDYYSVRNYCGNTYTVNKSDAKLITPSITKEWIDKWKTFITNNGGTC